LDPKASESLPEKLDGERLRARFSERKTGGLPGLAQKAVHYIAPSDFPTRVEYLSMLLFVGSVEESLGVVAHYAWAEKKLFLLIDDKNGFFVEAVPLPSSADCKQRAKVAILKQIDRKSVVQTGFFCDGINHREKPTIFTMGASKDE
jgi:hypothetical protein